jgi:hypothetical protein
MIAVVGEIELGEFPKLSSTENDEVAHESKAPQLLECDSGSN